MERELASGGLAGRVEWTTAEREELVARGIVKGYTARYLHAPETYPTLLDDPTNIRFYKVSGQMSGGMASLSVCRALLGQLTQSVGLICSASMGFYKVSRHSREGGFVKCLRGSARSADCV